MNPLPDPFDNLGVKTYIITQMNAAKSLGSSQQSSEKFNRWFNKATSLKIQMH